MVRYFLKILWYDYSIVVYMQVVQKDYFQLKNFFYKVVHEGKVHWSLMPLVVAVLVTLLYAIIFYLFEHNKKQEYCMKIFGGLA